MKFFSFFLNFLLVGRGFKGGEQTQKDMETRGIGVNYVKFPKNY